MNKFTKKTLHGAHVQLDNPIEVMTKATVLCGNSSKEFSQGTLLDGNAVNEVANDVANSTVETKAVEIESDIEATLLKLLPEYQYVNSTFSCMTGNDKALIKQIQLNKLAEWNVKHLYTITLKLSNDTTCSNIGMIVKRNIIRDGNTVSTVVASSKNLVSGGNNDYITFEFSGEDLTHVESGTAFANDHVMISFVNANNQEATIKLHMDAFSTGDNNIWSMVIPYTITDNQGNDYTTWSTPIAVNKTEYMLHYELHTNESATAK